MASEFSPKIHKMLWADNGPCYQVKYDSIPPAMDGKKKESRSLIPIMLISATCQLQVATRSNTDVQRVPFGSVVIRSDGIKDHTLRRSIVKTVSI